MQKEQDKLAIHGGKPVRLAYRFSYKEKLSSRIIMGKEEEEAVLQALKNNLESKEHVQFEEAFAEYCGVKHAIATSSGTAACHVSLEALHLDPGDEVLVTSLSDAATLIAILATRSVPVFVDVDPRTGNIMPEKIEEKVTNRTKAIMVVHLYGQPCEMEPIIEIARRKNLYLIEDFAQAHGAEYKGKKVGSMGDMSCCSFIRGKIMNTGSGGMVLTNNDDLAEKARKFVEGRGCIMTQRDGISFRIHEDFGLNYRMGDIEGAIGIAQLKKLDDKVRTRRDTAELLTKLIQNEEAIFPPYVIDGAKHAYWLYMVYIDRQKIKVSNYEFARALAAEGIECMPKEYFLLYLHPVLLEKKGYGVSKCLFECPFRRTEVEYYKGMCPNAEKSVTDTILLDWSEYYTKKDVEDIARILKKVSEYYRVNPG